MYTLKSGALCNLKTTIAALLLSTTSIAALPSYAEEVRIPLGQQGDHWNVERPRTGSSKSAVQMQFGEPISVSGPVGEPPITTWEYPGFNVYFEYDHVIHSVVKHKPSS